MNRASLDRGFGRCIVLRKYGTSMKKYANRTQARRPLALLVVGTHGRVGEKGQGGTRLKKYANRTQARRARALCVVGPEGKRG